MWKLFEADNAPQRGVIAFITNRKFLTGKPYAGLRKMMREQFDRIEIIDLRGDVRRGFAVSGYRVLPRWIEGRKGQPATLAFIRELRDVAARIHELIHHFDSADLVLAETLAHTLTRAELGFGDETEDVEPAEDD